VHSFLIAYFPVLLVVGIKWIAFGFIGLMSFFQPSRIFFFVLLRSPK
jgi:hypothetical protein